MSTVTIKAPKYAYNSGLAEITAEYDCKDLWIAPDIRLTLFVDGMPYGNAIFRKGSPAGSGQWSVQTPPLPNPIMALRVEAYNTGAMDSGLRGSAETNVALVPMGTDPGSILPDPFLPTWGSPGGRQSLIIAGVVVMCLVGGLVILRR